MKRIIIGVTGASGGVLAKLAIEAFCAEDAELHLVATKNGEDVFEYETELNWRRFAESVSGGRASVVLHDNNDLFADISSGSFDADAMLVVPCSMSTAARIAHGTGGDLLSRAADVCIKENRRLVIVPREAPLSRIHLENLLTLSQCGVVIVPPVPMFYDKRHDYAGVLDGIIGRILKSAGIENTRYNHWRKP